MGSIIDMTSATSFYTGSRYTYANTAGGTTVSTSAAALTGSWSGLANTWGGFDMRTILSASQAPTGSWQGNAYSWGMTTTVTESNDRFTVTGQGAPNVDQGIGPGAWSPFPTPEVPAEEPPPVRDVTRYRKSYSSQRMQPRPIRIRRG